ncbi:hypothetical protein [Clostridium saccharoperbutylacetonicum]|uniref:hypothetical protein n=1 Tax=Clostridium saccharoperbutylacetonicum TaxID=36745 RepID=UPI0039E8EE54
MRFFIKGINQEIEETAEEIKGRLPKIYSKELIELLFFEFYIKRVFIENGLNVSRKTASNYLAELEKEGFLTSEKI